MRKIILAVGTIFVSIGLSAQNFNESVEVTNELIVDMSGSERKSIPMEIPDSLSQFKYDFSYWVLATPYKGAYEFNPYNVLYRPVTNIDKRPFLYLNAGAGWGFAPTLDAVLTPRTTKSGLKMTIYQDFDAYIGKCKGVGQTNYNARELSELVGIDSRASFKNFDMGLNAYYHGMWTSNFAFDNSDMHTFGADLSIFAKDNLSLSFRTSNYQASPLTTGVIENRISFSGSLVPYSDSKKNLAVTYNTGYLSSKGYKQEGTYFLNVDPALSFSWKKVDLKFGAKMSLYPSEKHIGLYPDIKISYKLFKQSLELFVGAGGSDRLNSLYSHKITNPYFNELYTRSNIFLKVSQDKFNLFAGLEGRIGPSINYKVKSGYDSKKNEVLYELSGVGEAQAKLAYTDFKRAYADASILWKNRRVEFEMGAFYQKTDILKHSQAFDLPKFKAEAHFTYNWIERFYMGANVAYASQRVSNLYGVLPSYVDLGVHANYAYNQMLTFWFKGENLLGQRVESVPFTSRSWPIISLGLSLIFK